MANKLYEEEEVRQIAVSLRANAPRKIGQRELLLSEMSSSVDDVYLEGYENGSDQGYNLGLVDGEEKVKRDEARDESGIKFDVNGNLCNLTVTVDQGYYNTDTSKLISSADIQPIISNVYHQGVEDGEKNVREGEERTAENVKLIDNGVPEGAYSAYITVNVDAGYYAEDTEKTFKASDGDFDALVDGIYDIGHNDGYDAGHTDGYTEGYEEGLAAGGGGGGDEPYDPTTVWQLNDGVPIVTVSNIYATFFSNGEEFVRINHAILSLRYYRSDGTNVQVWNNRNGWDTAYQTITFPEEITDEDLITWLDTNATLIGGGSAPEEEEPLDDTGLSIILDQTQSPTVTIQNANLDNHYYYPVGIYGQRDDYNYTFDDYIEMEESSPSSNPFTLSAMNHTQLYAYIFVYVSDEANYEDFAEIIEVPPYGDNSLDFVSHLTQGNPCKWGWRIRGARFTRYAVEI